MYLFPFQFLILYPSPSAFLSLLCMMRPGYLDQFGISVVEKLPEKRKQKTKWVGRIELFFLITKPFGLKANCLVGDTATTRK